MNVNPLEFYAMFKDAKYTLIALLFISFFGASCEKEPPRVDVSHIDPNTRIVRFDSILATTDTSQMADLVAQMEQKYPTFTNIYFNNILTLPKIAPNMDRASFLKLFAVDTTIRGLLDTVEMVYGDFDAVAADLSDLNRHYYYHFPDRNKLEYYTIFSEFSIGNFLFPVQDSIDGVGIGLDFFLGDQFDYRRYNPNNPSFSAYLTRSFNKEHLVKKTAQVIVDDVVGLPFGNRFLDAIISNGKKLYIIDQLLPNIPDSILFEYTTEQTEWCAMNEKQIWAHFLTEDLLYSTKQLDFIKLINPSPNSPKMPEEAPGRTGNYIGYQIIKALMARESDLSLKDLVLLKDGQKILERSKYKPKK